MGGREMTKTSKDLPEVLKTPYQGLLYRIILSEEDDLHWVAIQDFDCNNLAPLAYGDTPLEAMYRAQKELKDLIGTLDSFIKDEEER